MAVGGPVREDTVLDALSSKPSRQILASCIRKARSARQIEETTRVPTASVYRVIKELVQDGLLIVERSAMTPDGKTYDLYRSRIRRAGLEVDAAGVHLSWDVYAPVEDRLMNMWERLSD
jgi:hypothetical protein